MKGADDAPAPLDPPNASELKSETGADFLPLANALYAGNFKEADQLTRDMLIFIAGPGVSKATMGSCSKIAFAWMHLLLAVECVHMHELYLFD